MRIAYCVKNGIRNTEYAYKLRITGHLPHYASRFPHHF